MVATALFHLCQTNRKGVVLSYHALLSCFPFRPASVVVQPGGRPRPGKGEILYANHLCLCPGLHRRAKRGPAAGCSGGPCAPRSGLSGQAVGQGLSTAPVPAAPPPYPGRRYTLHQKHRPPGAKLRGHSGPVAPAHQGDRGGHRCAGHALAGHPPGQGPDGHLFKRHRSPASVLRGRE